MPLPCPLADQVLELADRRDDAEVEGGTEVSTYALAPSLVLTQAEDKVVLIVAGTPSDDQGVPQAGHASTAALGAYWFEKRGERWFKVAEQPGFAEEGFFGDPGELRQVDLGGGKIALAIENGSCWQGSCGRWLTLYTLEQQQVVKVFDYASAEEVQRRRAAVTGQSAPAAPTSQPAPTPR